MNVLIARYQDGLFRGSFDPAGQCCLLHIVPSASSSAQSVKPSNALLLLLLLWACVPLNLD